MLCRSRPWVVAATAFLTLTGIAPIAPGGSSVCRAQEAPATKSEPRGEDRAAIRSELQSFVKAFEAGNAKGLAEHWTAEGEYQRDDGGMVQGQEALTKGFAEFFAKSPKVKAQTETTSLRFLSQTSAMVEGLVTTRTSSTEPAITSKFNALFVKEGKTWKIAYLREWDGEEASPLPDLGWLVGDWKSKVKENAVETSYAWDASKKFLHGKFTIKVGDETYSGFQVLGTDPATGDVRTWTFESSGGIGEGVWKRDGEHWSVDWSGTLADGAKMTSTNVLRKLDDNTFTWQTINRRVDDSELPDMPPTKVTRVKPSK